MGRFWKAKTNLDFEVRRFPLNHEDEEKNIGFRVFKQDTVNETLITITLRRTQQYENEYELV